MSTNFPFELGSWQCPRCCQENPSHRMFCGYDGVDGFSPCRTARFSREIWELFPWWNHDCQLAYEGQKLVADGASQAARQAKESMISQLQQKNGQNEQNGTSSYNQYHGCQMNDNGLGYKGSNDYRYGNDENDIVTYWPEPSIHSEEDMEQLCIYHLKGNCSLGPECRYRHYNFCGKFDELTLWFPGTTMNDRKGKSVRSGHKGVISNSSQIVTEDEKRARSEFSNKIRKAAHKK